MAPPGSKPFQLLEINIISAQDLEPVARKMRTYTKAWVNPNRKLSSCMDADGNTNPTWNDKFIFKVDEGFLRDDTSAVMIQIYASHWLRDILVGTVRVLVGNLISPPTRSCQRSPHHTGMRFFALQIRRPSGRPQGILNIGVALLDGTMRSMPLYRQLSASAVGFRDLMQDPPALRELQQKNNQKTESGNNQLAPNVKPILLRSRSERSERVTVDNYSPNSSIVGQARGIKAGGVKDSCALSISETADAIKGKKKEGKASSVISGAEVKEKPRQKGEKGKASSVVSDSVVSKESWTFYKNDNPNLKNTESANSDEKPTKKVVNDKSVTKVARGMQNVDIAKDNAQTPTAVKPITKYNGYDFGAQKGALPQGKHLIGGPFKGNSIWSESEVGPSPSEVAVAVTAEKKYPLDDNQSSVLDGWSLDESVEGLRSKLERWRMELPPLYDHGFSSSTSCKSSGQHRRRHSDNGMGLFSCFGNICGYECQCICGKPPRKSNFNSRFRSTSVGTSGQRYL